MELTKRPPIEHLIPQGINKYSPDQILYDIPLRNTVNYFQSSIFVSLQLMFQKIQLRRLF